MNERIKELLSQAGVHYEVMPKDTVYEKFAQLIVRECIEVASPNYMEYTSEGVYYVEQAVDKIAEHFGVK